MDALFSCRSGSENRVPPTVDASSFWASHGIFYLWTFLEKHVWQNQGTDPFSKVFRKCVIPSGDGTPVEA